MTIQNALKEKNMSIYRLAKASKVPYATVNDICNGKARLEKCTAETIYRLAHTLDVSMEELLAPCFLKRSSFENFKSTVCHRVKELGDLDFIMDTLESQEIRIYYDREWYPESLYLLAMLDYISRENDIPLCEEYDDLRRCKLEKPVYPAGIRAVLAISKDSSVLRNAFMMAIPEFKRFNIIENEVRNVI
ncbi:MAG: helix-turn-helix domain-containing protein [Lachnospiraceae bacterium]|nr:helix-turn-helix domain-containing protein [Lachnospiraceae bacterium]